MVVDASPLPVAPRPHPDELISSWLGRTAAVYDMEVEGLRASLLRNGDVAPGGVDVELDSGERDRICLLYTSPSPRDGLLSRMPSSA